MSALPLSRLTPGRFRFALSLGLMVRRGTGIVLPHRDLPPEPNGPSPSAPLSCG